MGARDAAVGHQHVLRVFRGEAAQRDVVVNARRQVFHHGSASGRVMDVDAVSSAGDGVIELPAGKHVGGGEQIVAHNAPGFANIQNGAALLDVCVLETGNVLFEKPGQLMHLTEVVHLGARQVPDIRSYDHGNTRAVYNNAVRPG